LASLVAMIQIDIKKLIAYSSVAHMNFSLFGVFSYTLIGIMGMFFLMLGHAITSGALFIGVGTLYDRYKTRLIFYYNSLVVFMPTIATFFFIYTLSNFGFPGTINFVGEFFVMVGGFVFNNMTIFLSTFGMIFSLIYSLSLYNRLFFGPIDQTFIRYYCDSIRLEFFVLIVFMVIILLFGLYPNLIFNYISTNFLRYSL